MKILLSPKTHQGSSPAVGILLVEVNKIDCTPKFFQHHEQSHVEYEPFYSAPQYKTVFSPCNTFFVVLKVDQNSFKFM